MTMILKSKASGDFKPHPEGIHPAVCVDVMDMGMMETEFQGQRRLVPKLRLVFESEQRLEDGRNCTISKNFTASLHVKAKLAEFLGKWRGRPVVPGETIDLDKLLGASCTLVISHQQNVAGQIYAAIDAISKPTKKLTPSGYYDPAAARQRLEEWRAKQAAPRQAGVPQGGAHAPGVAYAHGANPSQGRAVYAPRPVAQPGPAAPQPAYYQQPAPAPVAQYPQYPQQPHPAPVAAPQAVPVSRQAEPAPTFPAAPAAAQAPAPGPDTSYDPEVGF